MRVQQHLGLAAALCGAMGALSSAACDNGGAAAATEAGGGEVEAAPGTAQSDGGSPAASGSSDASTADTSPADATIADGAAAAIAADASDALSSARDVPPPLYLPDGACEPQLVEAGANRNPCSFTANEISCDASSDCHWVGVVGCCGSRIVGVNGTSRASCPPPPCPPVNCDPASTGLFTEYCQSVATTDDVAVACVAGRCVTYAAAVGSE